MTRPQKPAGGPPAPGSYEVGYARPPKQSQFKPGQSGNAKGRVSGARSFRTDLEAELRTEVPVTENGKMTLLRKQALAVKALVNKAAKGDVRALIILIDQIARLHLDEKDGGSVAPVSAADEAILRDFLQRNAGTSGCESDD